MTLHYLAGSSGGAWEVPASDPSDPPHRIEMDAALEGLTLNLTLVPSCGLPVSLTPGEARRLASALTGAAGRAEQYRWLP